MKKTFFILLTLLLIYISYPIRIFSAREKGAQLKIQASIPSVFSFRLFGYTSPNSLVQVVGVRVFAQVSADRTGYFLIDPLPVSLEAKELCVTTLDSERRIGFPLCIKTPDSDKPAEIGPLLLAPTVSLSTSHGIQNQTITAFGKTLPNADVSVSVFQAGPLNLADRILNNISFLPVQTVQAKDIPLNTIKSDSRGNFSINLPTQDADAYRMFVKAFYSGLPTLKSQTLSFLVASWLDFWVKTVLPRLLLLLILIVLMVWFIRQEQKTEKARIWYRGFNEKTLQPYGVRSRLRLRRLWYNLQDYLRSSRK